MTPVDVAPVSARSRALQVLAWRNRGGGRLMDRFYRHRRDLFAAVTTAVNAGRTLADLHHVRPLCTGIGDFARDADRYFRVPDAEAHRLWEQFVQLAGKASQVCEKSLDANQADPFNTAMRALASAQEVGNAIDTRIDILIRQGGL